MSKNPQLTEKWSISFRRTRKLWAKEMNFKTFCTMVFCGVLLWLFIVGGSACQGWVSGKLVPWSQIPPWIFLTLPALILLLPIMVFLNGLMPRQIKIQNGKVFVWNKSPSPIPFPQSEVHSMTCHSFKEYILIGMTVKDKRFSVVVEKTPKNINSIDLFRKALTPNEGVALRSSCQI